MAEEKHILRNATVILKVDSNAKNATQDYNGLVKSLKGTEKQHEKMSRKIQSANKKHASSIKSLSREYSVFSNHVKKIVAVAAAGGGFVQLAKHVEKYNKAILQTSSVMAKYGMGISEVERRVTSLSSATGLLMQEVMSLHSVFEQNVIFASFSGFEKIIDNIVNIVGPSKEAVEGMLTPMIKMLKITPGLQRAFENLSDIDRARIASTAKTMQMSGALSMAEARRIRDYVAGNKQMTAEDIKTREEYNAQQKALAALGRRFEVVMLKMGQVVMPWLEELSQWIGKYEGKFIKVMDAIRDKFKEFIDSVKNNLFGELVKVKDMMVTIGRIIVGVWITKGILIYIGHLRTALAVQRAMAATTVMGGAAGAKGAAGVGMGAMLLGAGEKTKKTIGKGIGGTIANGFKGALKRPGLLMLGAFIGEGLLGFVKSNQEAKGNVRGAAGAGLGASALNVGMYAATGAMLGSWVPGVGNVAGAAAGGAYGLYKEGGNLLGGAKQLITGQDEDADETRRKSVMNRYKAAQKAREAQKKAAEEAKKNQEEINSEMETGMQLIESYKATMKVVADLTQSQVGLFDSLVDRANVLGDVSMSQVAEQADRIRESLMDQNKIIAELAPKMQEAMLSGPGELEALLEAEGDAVASAEQILGYKIETAMAQKVMSDLAQTYTRNEVEIRKAALRVIDTMKTRVTLARTEASIQTGLVDLADRFAIGVGAGEAARMQAISAIQKETSLLEQQRSILFETMIKDPQASLEIKSKIRQLDLDILNNQKKQADQAKVLRDGWIGAIQSMNTGAGTFTKLIIGQQSNIGQMLKMAGPGGPVLSTVSGAAANARGGVGYTNAARFGIGGRLVGVGMQPNLAYKTTADNVGAGAIEGILRGKADSNRFNVNQLTGRVNYGGQAQLQPGPRGARQGAMVVNGLHVNGVITADGIDPSNDQSNGGRSVGGPKFIVNTDRAGVP